MSVNNRQYRRFTSHSTYQRNTALVRAEARNGDKRYFKTALVYAAVTALCLVFCAVYEIFSFGEHSQSMRMMFMIPLLGGAAPFGLMAASVNPPSISRMAFNLWNSGLAVHMSGCLVHGIIEISGRVPDYDGFYWAVSGMLLTAALVIQIASGRRNKQAHSRSNPCRRMK